MTNPVTPNIGLNKIDRTSPSTTYFDLEKYIDQNADAVDQFAGETKQSLDSLASRLDTEERREVVLQPGLQVVHAERTAPFSLSGIKGRTLVNLLGRDGGCESVRGFVVSSNSTLKLVTSFKDQGNYSIEVNQITTGNSYTRAPNAININPNRCYLALAVVKASSSTEVTVRLVKSDGSASLSGSKGNTIFPGETGLAWRAYNPTELNGNDSVKFEVFTNGAIPQGDSYCFDSLRLYEISSEEYEAIDNMSQNELSIKYPYIDGMQSVSNPYVIRYGKNLLPPFYEWQLTSNGGAAYKIDGPYKIQQRSKDPDNHANAVVIIPVIPGQVYTLNADIVKHPQNIPDALFFYWLDAEKNRLSGEGITTRKYRGTYMVPEGVRYMQMYVVIEVVEDNVAYKTQTVSNPMLLLGSDPMPFKRQEDSMLAFQTELHANSIDGSDPDVLFEQEGQYFKLTKWKKVELDGSLNWRVAGTSIVAAKVVAVDMFALNVLSIGERGVKYDGKVLTTQDVGEFTAGDTVNISPAGTLFISINNVDSGWGDNYRPTQDDIKAYFMGWKMYQGGQGNVNIPYNGTGSRAWVPLDAIFINGGTPSGSTYLSTLPTQPITSISYTRYGVWEPYQLIYSLVTPTVEPVVSEGCLTLIEGDNQVEVGTGIVLREGVKPYQNPSNGNTVINSTAPGQESSKVRFPVESFLSVYRSNLPDNSGWLHQQGDPYAYGKDRLFIVGGINYDPFAAYSVTYLKLDKSPIQPIVGTVAANEKAQISNLTAGISEALQRVSVVEQKKAEKDVPGWITPTLMNGWVPFSSTYNEPQYYKDSTGYVHIRGLMRSGATSTTVFVLPHGYRPEKWIYLSALTKSGPSLIITTLEVRANGNVYISGGAGTDWVQLDNISFLAEQ